jgi:hypothetical protein
VKWLGPDLRVDPKANAGSPIRVDELEVDKDGRTAVVQVALKSGAVAGDCERVVGRPSSSERVVIPIAVRLKDSQ